MNVSPRMFRNPKNHWLHVCTCLCVYMCVYVFLLFCISFKFISWSVDSLAEDGKSLPNGAMVLHYSVLQTEKVQKHVELVFIWHYLEGVSTPSLELCNNKPQLNSWNGGTDALFEHFYFKKKKKQTNKQTAYVTNIYSSKFSLFFVCLGFFVFYYNSDLIRWIHIVAMFFFLLY